MEAKTPAAGASSMPSRIVASALGQEEINIKNDMLSEEMDKFSDTSSHSANTVCDLLHGIGLWNMQTLNDQKSTRSMSSSESIHRMCDRVRQTRSLWNADVPPAEASASVSTEALAVVPNCPEQEAEYFLNADGSVHFNLRTTSRPTMTVLPTRAVNFTNAHVQFSMLLYDFPSELMVSPQMIQVIVESPSGIFIRSVVRNPPEDDEEYFGVKFLGHFQTPDEVGNYNIRARIVLPLDSIKNRYNFPDFQGIVGDCTDVLIARNYFKKSLEIPATCLQFGIQDFEQVNLGKIATMNSSKAWGLACDKLSNRLYLTQRVGNKVTCVDPNGTTLFQFTQNTPESMLNRPTGICCDEHNRRVILCDKDNHRVCIFNMEGYFIYSFGVQGHENGQFNYPWDVDVNSDGSRIVVTDSRNRRVQLFDSTGKFLNKFSVYENSPFEFKKYFDYPRGIAFDPDGELVYVTDFNSQNVIKLQIDFKTWTRIIPERKLVRPQGIVVDQIGTILVCDSRTNCVYNFMGDGQQLSVIRAVGGNVLQYPVNVTLIRDGHVAILDGQGRIHIF